MPSDRSALRSAELGRMFGALADPARLGVIALLRDEPLRSSEIAEKLTLNRPHTSKHLKVLRDAGLIEEVGAPEDARARIYQLRAAPFSELRTWLDDVESFWGEQLHAFKAHAEQRVRASRSRTAAKKGLRR